MDNVEIKAVLRGNIGDILTAICRVADRPVPLELNQVDTYFRTVEGQRLKLRVENGKSAQLIAYARTDTTIPMLSRYQIVEVADADAMCRLLTQALGVAAVVRKRRRVHFKDNVRIHFDEVEGLDGYYLELEVVLGKESEQVGIAKAHELMTTLGISPSDLIGKGYLDMLFEAKTFEAKTSEGGDE